MRDFLMPGLWEISAARPAVWDKVLAAQAIKNEIAVAKAFNAALPAISPQAIVAMGAAAVIARNPVVSRRFWQFWKG